MNINEEQGFWHPDHGYWQCLAKVTQEEFNSFPSGTKQVPIKPGFGYNYNGTHWEPPSEEFLKETAIKNIYNIRKKLLKSVVDPWITNTLRFQGLSTEEQNQMTEYRQALLDITKQPGYPLNITWPNPPSFVPVYPTPPSDPVTLQI